jgi:autotransporter-associated beta strand protein
MSGVISGPGKVVVNNPGGSLTLSGVNTYTGITEISRGHLIANSSDALGAAGTNNSGYLDIYGGQHTGFPNASDDTASLWLTGGVNVTKTAVYIMHHTTNAANVGPQIISVSGNNTLTGNLLTDSDPDSTFQYITLQANGGANLKIAGDIRQDHTGNSILTLRGAGTGEVAGQIIQPTNNFFNNGAVTGNTWELMKEGSGTWTLSGVSTISGPTTINNGKLAVNGSLTSGAVTVNGGSLGGTGTLNASVNVLGGTLSPGNSIGTLTIGGNLTLTAGSVDWEFSGGGGSPAQNAAVLGADVTNVQMLTIMSGVSLVGTNLGTIPLAWNTRLTVFGYTSGAPGTFVGMADDTLVSFGGQTWKINYDDMTAGINGGVGSKFVTLTAVPEASSLLVMGLGSLFALAGVWLGKRCGVAPKRG